MVHKFYKRTWKPWATIPTFFTLPFIHVGLYKNELNLTFHRSITQVADNSISLQAISVEHSKTLWREWRLVANSPLFIKVETKGRLDLWNEFTYKLTKAYCPWVGNNFCWAGSLGNDVFLLTLRFSQPSCLFSSFVFLEQGILLFAYLIFLPT